jgi:CelD/BcsL family acetyltransferase involved in cellulose biosynthesis
MPLSPELSNSSPLAGRQSDTLENHERGSLQVKKLNSWQEWEALSPALEQILLDTTGLTIFSTLEWLGAWWKAFGQERQLVAFSFANAGGEVLGLAPLYLEGSRRRRPGGVKRLRLVGDGTGDSDNLDLIFRAGHEAACSQALLARLDLERGWDVCELNTLHADSKMAQAMLSCLRERRWPTILSKRPSSAVLLPDRWETYLHELSREHASGIERYTKRLARHYKVRIFKCTTEEELLPSLEVLFDLHQKRWQSQEQLGSFAGPERRKFYYEMSRGFLRNGWLEFWLLELDGKPAAAQFAFRYRGIVYQLQEGLDPQHFSDRAGVVLRAHILKQLITEGVRQYDFLGGVDAHKQRWGAQAGNYVDISFARPLSRGSLHLFLRRRALTTKAWLNTSMPGPVLRFLRQINHRVLKSD